MGIKVTTRATKSFRVLHREDIKWSARASFLSAFACCSVKARVPYAPMSLIKTKNAPRYNEHNAPWWSLRYQDSRSPGIITNINIYGMCTLRYNLVPLSLTSVVSPTVGKGRRMTRNLSAHIHKSFREKASPFSLSLSLTRSASFPLTLLTSPWQLKEARKPRRDRKKRENNQQGTKILV